MSTKNSYHNKCKFLVSKFCKERQFLNWGKEISIAKKLLNTYPDMEFWTKLPHRDFGNTLSFFLTEEGKGFLQTQKKVMTLSLSEPETYELSEKKLSSDAEKETKKSKPKTLFEFLDYGEEN